MQYRKQACDMREVKMKYEWKKHEHNIYTNTNKPALITIPKQNYIMISGKGNPNGDDFAARIGVLMSLAYPIKMRHKANFNSDPEYASRFPYGDYTVFPLEGIWAASVIPEKDTPLDKENLIYTIMVRQPDFVTRKMFDAAYAVVEKKKHHPLLKEVKFDRMEDGLCIQMLHIGSFDDEPESFALMDAYAKETGYERPDHIHREIYLNDARKTAPEKLKTILRYRVKKG